MGDLAPRVLAGKAFTLLSQFETSPGSVKVTDRQAADLATLLGYAKSFSEYVPQRLQQELEAVSEAVDRARSGHPDDLLAKIADLRKQAALPPP